MSSVFRAPRFDDALYHPTPLCPHCEGDLDVHQPDEAFPDRLLATCPDCKSWFLTNPRGELGARLAHPAGRGGRTG